MALQDYNGSQQNGNIGVCLYVQEANLHSHKYCTSRNAEFLEI